MKRYYNKASEIIEKRFGETMLVVHGGSDTIYELNSTCSAIWDLLDGETEVADITKQLAIMFDVEAETIESDVLGAIAMLLEASLIYRV